MTRDLRKYASQTTVQLVVGAILVLFIVGLGLVWYFYGFSAAVMGVLCLVGATIPVGLIWLFLFGLDLFIKKVDKD